MLIPTLIVREMHEAIAFLTDVLDFQLVSMMSPESPFYAVLARDNDELHLNLAHQQKVRGQSSIIVRCDDVDGLFASFIARGLLTPTRQDSPVHVGPLDQSWGTREVYIDDPSGNTIIFQQR
jgi:catechol 2,3-dioxygenase-like lactoylglutathione lyase family enzyme